MLNHIVLMGRLTRDPELRYTGSNVPVASFSIAVDRDFGRGENGEKQTDFINVSAWRQTGEFVSKYFTKGSMIVVSGRLQIRNWTDKEGNKICFQDVTFSEDEDVVERLQNNADIVKMMEAFRDRLTDREKQIVIYRYGLYGNRPRTQRELAAEYGISRSYVSRIEKKALERMREAFRE